MGLNVILFFHWQTSLSKEYTSTWAWSLMACFPKCLCRNHKLLVRNCALFERKWAFQTLCANNIFSWQIQFLHTFVHILYEAFFSESLDWKDSMFCKCLGVLKTSPVYLCFHYEHNSTVITSFSPPFMSQIVHFLFRCVFLEGSLSTVRTYTFERYVVQSMGP